MKKREMIWLTAITLMVVQTSLILVAAPASGQPSQNGYQCCAIAFDTSQMGILLQGAAFLIGLATAVFLGYRTWAGVQEVRRNGIRRALRWVRDFVSKELLPTITTPPDAKENTQKPPTLLQSESVSPVIQLLGEFLKAAQSGDEETVDRIRGRLGKARSELERFGQQKQGGTLAVYFIYTEDEDDRPPPDGKNWRTTGRQFFSEEDADEYCLKLVKSDARIAKVMYYDTIYQGYTKIYTREEMLKKAEENTRTA